MRKKSNLIILLVLLVTQVSYGLTRAAEFLIQMETQANAVATRSAQRIMLPHFEIPLEFIEVNFAERLEPEIKAQLLFEKEGKTYARWILNPEDTKWHLEVAKYFKDKGIDLEKRYYFEGYQTASRSYIAEDPSHKIQFSVKSSTNITGGNWTDKKQGAADAEDSRLNADYIYEIQRRLKFKNIVVMDEPAILKIGEIDQGVVIRDIVDLNRTSSGKYYVPGFSVLHGEAGRLLAEKNGSKDPYLFWTEHYVKATGRALGELAARTGVQFDSPHSQNFLVELDLAFRPTGRIVIRDLADLYLDKTFLDVLHNNPKYYHQKFSEPANVINSISAGFGPLHGNRDPSWVDAKKYTAWGRIFFDEFEKTFSQESGLPISKFKSGEGSQNLKYFSNDYKVSGSSEDVQDFFKNLRKYKSPKGILNCSFVLMEI
jgi:hypothetical protein